MKRFAVLAAAFSTLAYGEVSYFVEPDLSAGSLRIKITLDNPGKSPSFCFPAWCPGWYVLTNSYKKVSDVKATDPAGAALPINHSDKYTWAVTNPDGKRVVLSYRILADERGLGFDYTHVDGRTAFINGPAAFMYVKDRIKEPTSLTIKAPNGWDIATPLTLTDGKYTANDYDEFIDSPIQMGAMVRKSFTIDSVPFEVVYVGRSSDYKQDFDYETDRLKKLSEPAIRLFGTIPCKKYTYFIHMGSGMWGGGLEHQASTVLDVGNTRPLGIDTLATHEFFHTWNVKNIRPKVLGPFDYTQPCRTRNLWFAEGVTDYYSKIMAYRTGLYDQKWLGQSLAMEAEQQYRAPTRLKVNLEDACYKTWEHGGFGYDDLSYYNKGLLVGWLFDAAIIGATDGERSLDDVMRSMYSKYRLPKPGYEEDAILKEINTITGKDMTALYDKAVRSTSELPYEILRSNLGIRLVAPNEYYWSVGFTDDAGTVYSANQEEIEAGLRIGDTIVSIAQPNDKGQYELTISRDGENKVIRLQAKQSQARGYFLAVDPFASVQARKNLKKWLAR